MAKPTYAELARRCEQYERRIQELEDQVRKLTQLLEEATRATKRQAAPFSKGKPKTDPKRPGRKAGSLYGRASRREPPSLDEIDETYDAPLPAACPHCGGSVKRTRIADQYQTEIPRTPIYRHFRVHVGECTVCGRRVQGRHALQTSNALGAAASQLGPDLQATLVELNKRTGASYDKMRCFLKSVLDIDVSNGGCAQVVLRAGRRLAPAYAAIKEAMAKQPCVSPDETGWRVGGHKAWLHVVAGRSLACYVIDPRRDASAAREMIGADFDGVMVHDGWAPYDQFEEALHQQCLAHLLRRCETMLEVATRGAVRFPRAVKRLLQDAMRLRERRDAKEISEHGLRVAIGRLGSRLDRLLSGTRSNRANRRFAQHLEKHREELFTFLLHRGVDATNWRAEQALRPAVVNRKVWGGNRTWRGAEAQSILMTVLQTCLRKGRSSIDDISTVLRGRTPRPLLMPGR
jgi:transposase